MKADIIGKKEVFRNLVVKSDILHGHQEFENLGVHLPSANENCTDMFHVLEKPVNQNFLGIRINRFAKWMHFTKQIWNP